MSSDRLTLWNAFLTTSLRNEGRLNRNAAVQMCIRDRHNARYVRVGVDCDLNNDSGNDCAKHNYDYDCGAALLTTANMLRRRQRQLVAI